MEETGVTPTPEELKWVITEVTGEFKDTVHLYSNYTDRGYYEVTFKGHRYLMKLLHGFLLGLLDNRQWGEDDDGVRPTVQTDVRQMIDLTFPA